MDQDAQFVANKLNLYSLKCGEARSKFRSAFAHQKKNISKRLVECDMNSKPDYPQLINSYWSRNSSLIFSLSKYKVLISDNRIIKNQQIELLQSIPRLCFIPLAIITPDCNYLQLKKNNTVY